MKRTLLFVPAALLGIIASAGTAVAVLRVAPAVVDLEVFPHSEAYFDIRVINGTGSLYRVAPTVGEFDAQSGTVTVSGTPYDSNTLISANIELPRGEFNLAPGASRSLTGKVIVSPYLPPGSYHAIVYFSRKAAQPGTGLVVEPDAPRALLNITVRQDIRERLNLNLFDPLRRISLRFPAQLSLTLHNGGNVPLTPEIAVSFYDRRDRERGNATAQIPGGAIGDDATVEVPLSWEGDHGFGRYRAHATVRYGVANGGQLLTASTSFWILPLWLLLLIAVLMAALSYGAARTIVRAARRRHVS